MVGPISRVARFQGPNASSFVCVVLIMVAARDGHGEAQVGPRTNHTTLCREFRGEFQAFVPWYSRIYSRARVWHGSVAAWSGLSKIGQDHHIFSTMNLNLWDRLEVNIQVKRILQTS